MTAHAALTSAHVVSRGGRITEDTSMDFFTDYEHERDHEHGVFVDLYWTTHRSALMQNSKPGAEITFEGIDANGKQIALTGHIIQWEKGEGVCMAWLEQGRILNTVTVTS